MFAFLRNKIVVIPITALLLMSTVGVVYYILDMDTVESPTWLPDPQPLTEQQKQFMQEQKKKPLLSKVEEMFSMTPVRKVPSSVTSTLFMFRGDFGSDLYDLFSLHKRAVQYCDRDTAIAGCDVKLPRNYKWGTLSYKLLDSLELMCKAPRKTDFYAKIDDDLIMSESKFDEILKAMAATDCQIGGGIARDYGFYWPVGQLYIFKRNILEQICSKLPIANAFHSSEDITFGSLLNSTDRSMFCSLDTPTNHWHKEYTDKRVKINYLQQHND